MSNMKIMGAFTLLAVASLTIMVGCVIVPGLSEIAINLGVPSAASWLVTIPSLGVIIFGYFAGKLIDKVGAYRALSYGLFGYGFLGCGGMFLHGFIPVMLDRLLLGGAAAIVMSSGTVLISSFYQGSVRLKMIAAQGVSIELGGVIFLFIGGLLATLGWHWPFLLYLVAWLLLALQLLFVPKLSSDNIDGKNVTSEFSGKNNRLNIVYFSAIFSMICFFTGIIIIPQYFYQHGINAAYTGYFLSFVSLVAVFAAALMPKAVKLFKEYGTLYIAFFCYITAHILFSIASDVGLLIVGGFLMGGGFGLSIPLVNHMTVEQSQTNVRGRNLAYLSIAIFSGQFLSSFMEFIPGDSSVIFLGAAGIGIIAIITLIGYRRLSINIKC